MATLTKTPERMVVERESADELARRLIPGRVRLSLAIYDFGSDGSTARPGYRQMPGLSIMINVRTQAQLRRLWKALEMATKEGEWRDDKRRSGSVGSDLADSSADVPALGAED